MSLPDSTPKTVGRHPVADLLTDEMRARVAAATFRTVRFKRTAATANSSGRCVCPLGVAVGITRFSQPAPTAIITRLGLHGYEPGARRELRNMVLTLIYEFDDGNVAPEDVKTLLGVGS